MFLPIPSILWDCLVYDLKRTSSAYQLHQLWIKWFLHNITHGQPRPLPKTSTHQICHLHQYQIQQAEDYTCTSKVTCFWSKNMLLTASRDPEESHCSRRVWDQWIPPRIARAWRFLGLLWKEMHPLRTQLSRTVVLSC